MADTVEPNPTLARRVLAVRLKALREQHGQDLPWLAGLLDVDLSQASRLDTGARGFQPEQVEALCAAYVLAPVQVASLKALAEEARKRAWWQQVKVAPSYRTLIGLERAAVEINEFCSSVVPGLLQTREYAEAAVKRSQVEIPDAAVKQAVDVRMRRATILDRKPPPNINVVFDEAVLARGPQPDVMEAQLQHLLDVSARANVRVQVMPFDRGLYPVGDGQYILLRLPEGLPDVYYAESELSVNDTDSQDTVHRTRVLWNAVQGLALSTTDSVKLIDSYLRRLE